MVNLERFGIMEGQGKYYEESVYSIALIYNVCNTRITAYLRNFNLTPGKLNILLIVKHKGGPDGISQVDVSKHLIVTPSNMTKMVDKLEKEGLVTRSAQEGDRRVNILKITQKGEDLLDSIWTGYNKQLEELINVLPKEDQKTVSVKLKKWLDMLSEN